MNADAPQTTAGDRTAQRAWIEESGVAPPAAFVLALLADYDALVAQNGALAAALLDAVDKIAWSKWSALEEALPRYRALLSGQPVAQGPSADEVGCSINVVTGEHYGECQGTCKEPVDPEAERVRERARERRG